MSPEHLPVCEGLQTTDEANRPAEGNIDYWMAYIPEREAARFLELEPRTMQGLRQRGGGPIFFRLSSRCLRYRRADLRAWADERARTSTSDPGRAS